MYNSSSNEWINIIINVWDIYFKIKFLLIIIIMMRRFLQQYFDKNAIIIFIIVWSFQVHY